MKCALAGLLCALLFSPLAFGQDQQPDTARPVTPRRPERGREPLGSGRQITLDVLIADLTEAIENPTAAKILELEKAGKLAAATRLQLATLDELPGFIQFGGRMASRTMPPGSRGGTPGPGTFPQPTPTSVQLQATTRIDEDDSIIMQIYIERPEAAVPQKVVPADATDDVRRSFAILLQNTVRFKQGEAIIVGGRRLAVQSERSQTWVVATATASPK